MNEFSASPRELTQLGDRRLKIVWEDGHQSLYDFARLRASCPCAACIDEWTGLPRLDPGSVAADLRVEKIQPVGNYALAFQFADGHSTGVYSFEKLRRECSCESCLGARGQMA